MTNFIFKSQWTYKKLANTLEIIQSELRHQRSDHDLMRFQLKTILKIVNNLGLQKQVDEYFEDDAEDKAEHIPEE